MKMNTRRKLSENGISDSSHAFSLHEGGKQPLKLAALNGGSLVCLNSVSSSHSSPIVEKNSPISMECLICHKVLMDDSKFIQCSLIDSHKFCLMCSRDSIKQQLASSKVVYCPSGCKCLLTDGSTKQWTFKKDLIVAILEAEC